MMTAVKRFMLFAGDQYYPGGGWCDFIDSFNEPTDAEEAGKLLGRDWYHVVGIENPIDPGDAA